MSLLGAPARVTVVVIARARVIIVLEIVVVTASVCMFNLHLRLNSVLYFLTEVQDVVLVAEVVSALFNKLNARLLVQRLGDDIAMDVLGVKLAPSFTHIR